MRLYPAFALFEFADMWRVFASVAFAVLMLMLIVRFYRRYLGVGRGSGYLLAVGTVGAAIATAVYQGILQKQNQFEAYVPKSEMILRPFCFGILVLTGLPLVIKLYRGWVGGHVTMEEKATGVAGVRAWLSPTNLILALSVSICAAKGLDYSILGVFAFTILAVLAYPAFMTLSLPAPSSLAAERVENLTAEREKVLSLLEVGKITAEECAELLNALGMTLKSPEPRWIAVPLEHRTMLIGAALVGIGFFLPWFTMNLGNEMANATREFAQQFPGISGQLGQLPTQLPNGSGTFSFQTGSVNISGGDVRHGLGWVIMLLSAGAALLPLVAPQFDPELRRTASMLALGVGALLLLYLLTSNLRFLNIGIVFVSAGYFAQGVCISRRGGVLAAVASAVGERA